MIDSVNAMGRDYPVLVRHQGHSYHDYTLHLAANMEVRLTEQQVLSLREQIDQDQKPISDEDAAKLRAALADIREGRRSYHDHLSLDNYDG